MAKYMKPGAVIEMATTYFPHFLDARRNAIRMDKWVTGRQHEVSDESPLDVDVDDVAYGLPFAPPDELTEEYRNIRGLSPNSFAGLIVTTLAQTAYVEGISRPGVKGTLSAWETWQRNNFDRKQIGVHRGAIGTGTSYGVVVPAQDPLTGAKMAKMIGKSSKTMAAFYDNDDDEWCTLAIEAHPLWQESSLVGRLQIGWTVTVYDAYVNHRLTCKGNGLNPDDWTYIDHVEHGMPVPPVARCANRLDLDGQSVGEIEPVLPLLRRIDQDTFDRLVVQRFGAWQVRYITGMAKPGKDEAAALKLRLKIEDILISENPDSKIGVLPAGPLEPLTKVTDHDLRLLAAISQTPPHHLLGLSSNLQAEALAAAEAGLQRKSHDFRMYAGEFHEQMARLSAMAEGDMATAAAWDIQVRWRDTESRSMTQAADALGKLAVQLKVPLPMLWERIPGWTDTDVKRAEEMVQDSEFQALMEAIESIAEENDDLNPDQQTSGDDE